MVRTPSFDKNGMKKGAWSPEEDNKLRVYIQRHGHWNWRQLPKFAGLSRCGKSCRLRWMNYLRPNMKRGNYTKEEEDLIVKLHERLGNKWSAIAAKLPGRTDNEVKNHWHTHLKKFIKENQSSKNTEERDKFHPKTGRSNRSKRQVSHKNFAGEPQPQPNPETSALFLEPPSSSEISSTNSGGAGAPSGGDWVAEETVSWSESLAEHLENFWTEPFLADTSYDQNGFPSALEGEGEGFLFPHALYYDDETDFWCQLRQDLPQC